MQFPLSITYPELAKLAVAQDPDFADNECPSDDYLEPDEPFSDDIVANTLWSYAGAIRATTDSPEHREYKASPHYNRLPDYLAELGFVATDEGLTIRDENALRLAHALFCTIFDEYDRVDEPHPTWTLFNLGGDDDVDYYGTQPSTVTSILITALKG